MSLEERAITGSALRRIFKKYAIENEQGQLVIPSVVFVRDFLRWDVSDEAVSLVARVADLGNSGSITIDEFMAVERIMRMPDAHFRLAFRMCDKKGKGNITVEDYMGVMEATQAYKEVQFTKDCSWMKLHFGRNLQRHMRPDEFPQFIASVPREHIRQAFQSLIKDSTDGSIDAMAYCDTLAKLKGPSFTKYLRDNLLGIMTAQTTRISYSYFTALNALIHNIELVKQIFSNVVDKLEEKEITKDQFDQAAWRFSEAITPVQTTLLWRLLDHDNSGKIALKDFALLIPTMTVSKQTKTKEEESRPITASQQVAVQAYRFAMSSIGGAAGAATVYPIDLVKTRLQNQVTTIADEVLYKNSFDCFKKVLKFEGIRGLYRGILPQLCGVAPEKAIKMTTNDAVRQYFTDPKSGSIPFYGEVLAGGMGGCAQVMFTNPIEIVKIRLQIAGEVVSNNHVTAMQVAKELGFAGLYKGARACLLRDAPFSAIYFPTYAHLKKAFADRETGVTSFPKILLAATLAGVPSASLVTPADVIKTRLQVKPKEGVKPYTGLISCAKRLHREEGMAVFWKGAPARMFRSSPQFGVTLGVYEMLQRWFPYGPAKHIEPPKAQKIGTYIPYGANPDHIGGYRNTERTFANLEQKLGLWFPRSGKIVSTEISKSGDFKIVMTEGRG